MDQVKQDLQDLKAARDVLQNIAGCKSSIHFYEDKLKNGIDQNPNVGTLPKLSTSEGENRRLQAEKEYAKKTKGLRIAVCTIMVLLNLAVFAYSIYALLTAPETAWIKTATRSGTTFWIGHILVGLILVFLPVSMVYSFDIKKGGKKK